MVAPRGLRRNELPLRWGNGRAKGTGDYLRQAIRFRPTPLRPGFIAVIGCRISRRGDRKTTMPSVTRAIEYFQNDKNHAIQLI
jgi:hypothetical protein